MLTRRELQLGLVSAAFGGLAGCSMLQKLPEYASRLPGFRTRRMLPLHGYGPLINRSGPLDLPGGFCCHVISAFGDPLSGGGFVPNHADGMGAFALEGTQVALVRNHEVGIADFANGPFPKGAPPGTRKVWRRTGDQPRPGGTTTIVYDYREHRRVDQYLSLVGTVRNCSGGTTPWRTWLSCEEEKDQGQDHGWVFEVAAIEPGEPQQLSGLGRFRHEAAAVDPGTGIVYMTEDDAGGLFYRFVPKNPLRPDSLHEGHLEALAFEDPMAGRESSNWHEPRWCEREPRNVRWIELEGTDNPANDLRRRGYRDGAVRFAFGEGIHFGRGEIYFTCTSGGRIKSGQIMRYKPSPHEGRGHELEATAPGRLEIFLESTDPRRLNYADNLTVAPNGHLIVCEDPYVGGEGNYLLRPLAKRLNSGSVCYVRGITPNGHVYDIARLRAWSELAGACFSPDGETLFVNIYNPAKTVAIRGPWGAFVEDVLPVLPCRAAHRVSSV